MSPARHSLLARALAVGCVALGAAGCFYNDQGLPPPGNSFYFPTGLVVSPGRTALYVANSDFDLQYNGGTVQVLDLRALRGVLGNMLAGVRCTEGVASQCADANLDPNNIPTLSDFCNTIPVTQPGLGLANGSSCTYPTDCASGHCDIDSGTCAACAGPTDCPGGVDPTCPGFCTSAGTCTLSCVDNQPLNPGACSPFSPPFAKSMAGPKMNYGIIGAFASGAVLALPPKATMDGHARLFVPVRGDPSITWFDVEDDRVPSVAQNPQFLLDCGQSADNTRCVDEHRMGVDPYDNFRDQILQVEPVGLDVSDDGTEILSAHQVDSAPAVGLSVNPRNGGRPTFEFTLTGNVAAGPSEVAHIPVPGFVTASNAPCPSDNPTCVVNYQQGFLVSYNAAPEIDLFRVDPDSESSPARPFVSRAGQSPVTLLADGKDSRGIALDASDRKKCEAACGAGDTACLQKCTVLPIHAFIANRAPASLLLGQVQTTTVTSDQGTGVADALEIYGTTPVMQGASKVAIGNAIGPDGKTAMPLVFVVSFDTRYISMFDPSTQQDLQQPIRTGRGPHPIAFDSCTDDCAPGEKPHAYLYVGHFTDSYIGVVDLDMSHPETFGTMFASVGLPIPPLESR